MKTGINLRARAKLDVVASPHRAGYHTRKRPQLPRHRNRAEVTHGVRLRASAHRPAPPPTQ